MQMTIPESIRWLLLLPISLFITTVVQVLVFRIVGSLLMSVLDPDPSSIIWIAKSITSPFMGAAFVATTWWLAPRYKNIAAGVAVLLAAFWGLRLIIGGFSDGLIWLFLMGALGFAGAIATFFVIRDRPSENLY